MMVDRYMSKRGRFAQMLGGSPNLNNGSIGGGLAEMLKSGLQGYMLGADQKDQRLADEAMMSPDAQARLTALRGLEGNEYAGRLARQLNADQEAIAARQKQIDSQLVPVFDQNANAMTYQTRGNIQPGMMASAPEQKDQFETVQSPYGKGGVGQRNTATGQITGYQAPQQNEDPFGGGLEGKMWEAYNSGPQDPRYASAVAYLSTPRTMQTPSGLVQIPAAISRDGSLAGSAPAGPVDVSTGGAEPAGPRVVIPAPEKPQKFTEAQSKAGNFANMMAEAEKMAQQLSVGPGAVTDGKPGVGEKVVGAMFGEDAANTIRDPNRQKYRNAQEAWVRAKLRKESGAVIGEEEMEREISTYFPQIGDSPEVIQQKASLRQFALTGMMNEAGGAYRPSSGQIEVKAPSLNDETPSLSDSASDWLKRNPFPSE